MAFEPDVRHFLWIDIAVSCLRQGIDITPELIIENAPIEIKKKESEGKVCNIITNYKKEKTGRYPSKDKNDNWIFNLYFLNKWYEDEETKLWFDNELKKVLGFGQLAQREWLKGKIFTAIEENEQWAIKLVFESTGMSIIEEEGISEDDDEDTKNTKRKENWLRKLGQKAMSSKGTFQNLIAYGEQMGWQVTNKEDKFLQDYYGGLDLVGTISDFRIKLEKLETENKKLKSENEGLKVEELKVEEVDETISK